MVRTLACAAALISLSMPVLASAATPAPHMMSHGHMMGHMKGSTSKDHMKGSMGKTKGDHMGSSMMHAHATPAAH